MHFNLLLALMAWNVSNFDLGHKLQIQIQEIPNDNKHVKEFRNGISVTMIIGGCVTRSKLFLYFPDNCTIISFISYQTKVYQSFLFWRRKQSIFHTQAQCLKITQKVWFNFVSYVYILSGQKFLKNAQNGPICRVSGNLKLVVKQSYQTGQF